MVAKCACSAQLPSLQPRHCPTPSRLLALQAAALPAGRRLRRHLRGWRHLPAQRLLPARRGCNCVPRHLAVQRPVPTPERPQGPHQVGAARSASARSAAANVCNPCRLPRIRGAHGQWLISHDCALRIRHLLQLCGLQVPRPSQLRVPGFLRGLWRRVVSGWPVPRLFAGWLSGCRQR